MATYIPNASDATQPTEEKTVESAALEFRTLKAASSKSLAVPESGVSAVPAAAVRAGKILAFDSVGNPTVATLGTSSDPSLRADLAAVGGESLVHGLVGENSTITRITNLTSINGGQLGGFRNKIINGKMAVQQRGASGSSVASGSFMADRFLIMAGAGAYNWSFTAGPSQDLPTSLLFGCTTAADYWFGTRIEDARTLHGSVVTVSYWAKASSAITLDFLNIKQSFGPGGSAAVDTTGSSGIPLTTTWQKFTHTITLPSVEGKTFGAGTFLELSFHVPASTTGIYITGVQLELGAVATPFEQRPYGLELMLCQRYFQIPTSQYINTQHSTTTSFSQPVPLAVTMRISPTPSTIASWTIQGVTAAATGVTLVASTTAISASWTGTNGLSDRQSALLAPNQLLTLSAEL